MTPTATRPGKLTEAVTADRRSPTEASLSGSAAPFERAGHRALPAFLDVASAGQVYDRLSAAVAAGAGKGLPRTGFTGRPRPRAGHSGPQVPAVAVAGRLRDAVASPRRVTDQTRSRWRHRPISAVQRGGRRQRAGGGACYTPARPGMRGFAWREQATRVRGVRTGPGRSGCHSIRTAVASSRSWPCWYSTIARLSRRIVSGAGRSALLCRMMKSARRCRPKSRRPPGLRLRRPCRAERGPGAPVFPRTILAETGDPARFATARALVKHTGLCLRDNASGAAQGKTSISGPAARPAARRLAGRVGGDAEQPGDGRTVQPPDHPAGQPAGPPASPDRLRGCPTALDPRRGHPPRPLGSRHRSRNPPSAPGQAGPEHRRLEPRAARGAVKTRAGRARTSLEEPTSRMSMGSPARLLSKLDSRCRETSPLES